MKTRHLAAALLLCASAAFTSRAQEVPYLNPALSPEERTADLLSRMTLEEKIGQTLCPLGWPMYEKVSGKKTEVSDKFKDFIENRHGGMLWATFRADPWTQKTLETGLNPSLAAQTYNKLQKYAIEHSRLGIPIILAEEAPHGHMAIGTTVFPTGIGLSSSWDTALMEQVGKATAEELRAQGGHIAYGPVIDLAREPRWSRVEETYGEDVYLTSEMASAIVRGESPKYNGYDKGVISTLKHFIAYGIPEGGHNGNPSFIGERDLYENFLPPFKAATDAGALSVMTSYNAIDGVPSTANATMLKGLLREQWGFGGFVVSDLESIDGLWQSHHVASDRQNAGEMALKAGVDVDLGANCYSLLEESIRTGKIDESLIDEAAGHVLRLKFALGLFDNPYIDPKLAASAVRNSQHVVLARQTAREGIVLLENHDVLPLDKSLKVAVIGPNADNMYNQLGDYTAPQPRENIKTVLDGITAKVGKENVIYAKGCAIRDTSWNGIAEAVAAADKADVAVVVVGGSSARDFKTKYIDTGAAVVDNTSVSDMESGEGFDRATLSLLGLQNDLLEAIHATGIPMVVVYIEGRPLDKTWAKENADALLTAWYPGQEGGNAIADVLFGDYNPAGRLPVSVPVCTGQLPVYYNKRFPAGHDYVEVSRLPLYEFGYGLSYTAFEYSGLRTERLSDESFKVSFDIRNTGKYDGDEVAQVYVTDLLASTARPQKQLRAFRRIHVPAGETVHAEFVLDKDAFMLYDASMTPVVEPGDFRISVGASSEDIRLEETVTIYGNGHERLTSYVNPFIGSGGHGHVFVGANVPHGMVQLGPVQPNKGWDWCSGYHWSGEQIIGFSHTRLSGTGIGDLGDILFMPYDPDRPLRDTTGHVFAPLDHAQETVMPGYYSIEMDEYGLKAEMTATERAGLHRYTFSGDRAAVLIDLTSGVGWDEVTDASLEVIDAHTVAGYRRSSGWAKDHIIYFTARFSLPITNAAEIGGKGKGLECDLLFDTSAEKVLTAEVALSPVSTENAMMNLEAEVPCGTGFDAVRMLALDKWDEALDAIEIDAMSPKQKKVFYTAMYHTMFAPFLFCDVNGDYRGADGKVYNSSSDTYTVFSLWDTYRTASPLMTIIDPEMAANVAGTFLDIFQQQGKLPVWHLAANETDCMVGNPGVIVLGDLFLKGFVSDSTGVLEAMKVSAMKDERGQELLKEYGYIPFDKSKEVETVSKGLEFAIADAAVAKVADAMGDNEAAEYFGERSMSYTKYFDRKTGFMRGRAADGSFRTPFDPFKALHMRSDYTEGNAWQYTWLVPQDVHGLIGLLGGEKRFLKKLEQFFVAEGDLGGDADDVSGLIGQYAHGNEPSHHIAYMFNYAGRQDRCAETVRLVLDSLYFDNHSGVCGNEDAGQMSAWYVMSSLGIYQVDPAGGKFVIGSPAVNKAVIDTGNGRKFTVIAYDNSPENVYVQKVRFNGKPLEKTWIEYEDIVNGGLLEFFMGPEPSGFGKSPDSRP